MMCVYAIENIFRTKFYIGSTVDFSKRRTSHFNSLRKGTHSNNELQQDFNFDGNSAFVVYPLEEVYRDVDLKCLEEKWISSFKSEGFELYNVYNRCNFLNGSVRDLISSKCSGSINGNYHRPHTVEEKRKSRINRWGADYVPCSMNKSYYKPKTKEEKMESRKRKSEFMKNRIVSDTTKEKLRNIRLGSHLSDSTRIKLSELNSGYNNGNSKLTEKEVLEIYDKMNNGVNYKDVMREYGVGQCLVYKIKRKEHWVFYGKKRND